ncbi:MAG: hypothetical protein A2046_12595 [Bacteroidetes bacterium GWA2_30_7]|nr:MAG: hypothetical protein A2046_12595 [Bacteroidetes bacterium GWA2_30_7]
MQIIEINLFEFNVFIIYIINYLLLLLVGLFIYKNIKLLFTLLSVDNNVVNIVAVYSSFLFILNPYNTEVINWFSAQSYLFCSLLFLISLNYYLKFKSKLVFLFVSIFLLLLSFLSKETSVFSLVLFITLEAVIFKETISNNLKTISLYISVTVFYFILLFFS